jgi:hypothetical protein
MVNPGYVSGLALEPFHARHAQKLLHKMPSVSMRGATQDNVATCPTSLIHLDSIKIPKLDLF